MLARDLEKACIATLLITMMPFWAEKIGVPRTLGIGFPFGQTLGQPHNQAQQMSVLREALQVLETAVTPATIIHSDQIWPIDTKTAIKQWQPKEPAPVIKGLAPQLRQMLKNRSKRT